MSEQPARTVPPTMLAEQADRLSALFQAHSDRLYRLARRLVPAADDALDLVQETFLKASRSPESIPCGLKDEEAWLVRVLVNVRRDQWRKEAVRKRHERELSHAAVQHDDPEKASDPDDGVENTRLLAATSPSCRRDVRTGRALDGLHRVPPWHQRHCCPVASLSGSS